MKVHTTDLNTISSKSKKVKILFYFTSCFLFLACLFPIQLQAATLEVGPAGYTYSSIQDA